MKRHPKAVKADRVFNSLLDSPVINPISGRLFKNDEMQATPLAWGES